MNQLTTLQMRAVLLHEPQHRTRKAADKELIAATRAIAGSHLTAIVCNTSTNSRLCDNAVSDKTESCISAKDRLKIT